MNDYNFHYDLGEYHNGHLQYTKYTEGDFYNWHCDLDIEAIDNFSAGHDGTLIDRAKANLANDNIIIRKLSFSLLLSDSYDYEGGDFQIYHDHLCQTAPRERGTMVVFDSRIRHRVTKVKSGTRESLVGWVGGPRWK